MEQEQCIITLKVELLLPVTSVVCTFSPGSVDGLTHLLNFKIIKT